MRLFRHQRMECDMRLRRYTTRRHSVVLCGETPFIGITASIDDPHPDVENHLNPHVINQFTGKQHTLMVDFGKTPDGQMAHVAHLSKRDCLHLAKKVIMERKHLGISDEELAELSGAIVRILGTTSRARA